VPLHTEEKVKVIHIWVED